MVTALPIDDINLRRAATVAALDARLSVWGHAARDGAQKRLECLVEGAAMYAARVGRNAEHLALPDASSPHALLDSQPEALVMLAASVLPAAVRQSCRLLWVDPERLGERMTELLQPALEEARGEVRRLQALYRRRARLWRDEQDRLDKLREEIEALRLPRVSQATSIAVAKGLLEHHLRSVTPRTTSAVSLNPASLTAWIGELS